ncbi:RNA-directed DNA polymerase, eukaryota, reverse transcriptase zinc-binding domain protein [Tanacetum coccineum]
MANNTGCAYGSFLFVYLGLPIGSNMGLTSNWKILIDRFHARLSTWKANLLSIGGRLTLIKFVLGSLGIYYLSIFKVPESTLKSLESGLGIGSLKSFNLALLQKWHWRMYSNPNAFWVKVINTLHGHEGGFDHHGCKTNGIWAKIIGSSNYLHSSGILPGDSIRFQVGCGNLIRFWKDTWLGNSPLHLRYNRLFRLDLDKDCLIRDRISNGQWSWHWSRTDLGTRNPHRLNLSSRGIEIPDISCPSCNGFVESNQHIFFECNIAKDIWRLVRIWCDNYIPLFSSFDHWIDWSSSWSSSSRKFHRLYIIFASSLWLIWRFRNCVTFNS